MAKKKKKKESEDSYVFTPPEFDEREFIENELKDAKVSFVSIGFAFVLALVSAGLTFAGQPGLGFLLGLFSLILLRHVYSALKVDTSHFEKKHWLGQGATFFLSWLAVWILLCNPPFSDLASPSIEDIQYFIDYDFRGTLVPVNDTSVLEGKNLTVVVNVTDNVRVESAILEVRHRGNTTNPTTEVKDINTFIREYTWKVGTVSDGIYTFTVHAEDINGNSSERTFELAVGV